MVSVTQLAHFPVKGCAAVYATQLEIIDTGPRDDRTFMVIDSDGVFQSQRRTPRLAVVTPEIDSDGSRLTLHAPGLDTLTVDVRHGGGVRDVTLFGAPLSGVDQGDSVAQWFSELLGSPSRLVALPHDHRRVVPGLVSGTAGFADSGAVTLVSESSLALLDQQIRAGSGQPVPPDQFRQNIIVEGWPEPHTEDGIRAVAIGGARLGFLKRNIRCAVTTVDQASGVRSGREPLRTLNRYRRATEGGVAFGIKLSVMAGGIITVGDRVDVTEWKSVDG